MASRGWRRRARERWVALGLLALACSDAEAPAPPAPAPPQPPAFVGAAACADCHPGETAAWRGSDHERAMEVAGDASVEGSFDGAELVHFGRTTRFERDGADYVVRTEGEDGQVKPFRVAYTFGFRPLQQLLVPFPDGRLQALTVAWDARPAAAGGQRWFDLRPDEPVPPGDALHWTGAAYRWDAMCADCHSTAVETAYDPDTGRFRASWSDVDVACEACHGPGSVHVERARGGAPVRGADSGLTVRLRDERRWVLDPGDRIAHREPPRRGSTEIETCAPCHARRARIAPRPRPGAPFLDGYRPALLDEGLYYPDGQILDEVYVWGSFVQSRMAAAGVTCSDCHDPHRLAIESPDRVCTGCHRPSVFATPAHHHHDEAGAGASCVACHMPARTYMGVDARRDHGFRVPRPDVALRLGVPDPCTRCHTGRSEDWAAAETARLWGGTRARADSFADVLAAGRRGDVDAAARLATLAADGSLPAIVRATGVGLLEGRSEPEAAQAVVRAAGDPEPLLRLAAVRAAEGWPPESRQALLASLLRDPLRAVRSDAARALATLPPALRSAELAARLPAALAEYRAGLRSLSASSAGWMGQGILHADFGEWEEAERAYRVALRLSPQLVPARVNLADVLRQKGDEAGAEKLLREALALAPGDARVLHALGLLLVRTGRLDDALDALGRAAAADPRDPRHAYVYALGLHEAGRTAEALGVLEAASARHPADRDLLVALASISRDAGQLDRARRHARALLALDPQDPAAAALLRELQRAPSP